MSKRHRLVGRRSAWMRVGNMQRRIVHREFSKNMQETTLEENGARVYSYNISMKTYGISIEV